MVAPPEPAVLLACRRLSAAVDLFDDACCERLRLNRSDLRALNLLEHGPVSMKTIADGLGLTPGSVTQLVDRLERHRWVERAPSPVDRRSTAVRLLPDARQKLADLYAPLGRAVVEAFAARPRTEAEYVAQGMQQVAGIFDHARAGVRAGSGSR